MLSDVRRSLSLNVATTLQGRDHEAKASWLHVLINLLITL